ncbi:DUF4405 domain-containing protein [Desulfovibrio sp. TomC]|uniref:DUF4405 domain-containing protein n=1 Tax=Desulfovibrio sp. TomC TaxID=1562888 RepID=UPI0005733542|nr:DUF4405 domain-containing protein [Desulfovibrio sp. TomC]KHK02495.1 FHA domain containing protein [Desulfovibrio sp. TomC]
MPKKIVTLVLFFSIFFMFLTALVMFIVPPARVASWADWNFLGLSRQAWEGAHLAMGLLFLAAGVAHLLLHIDELLDHLRDDEGIVVVFTKPFLIGLALTIGVFVAALAGAPPVGQLVALSGHIKERTVETYGEPPYSLAERSTLADFARRMGMETDKALALLRLRNIKAESADLTLAQIARQNRVAPGGVFEALKMVMEPSGGTTPGLPKDPPPGLGRRKLSDICEEYGLDMAQALSRLTGAGYKAQPAWTLTETAQANNILPITVYEALRAEKIPTPTPVEVTSGGEPVKPSPASPVEATPTTAQPASQAHTPVPAPTIVQTPAQPAAGAAVSTPSIPSPAIPPAPGYATPAPGAGSTAGHGPLPPVAAPAAPGYGSAPSSPAPGYGAAATPAAPGYGAAPAPAAPGYAPSTAPGAAPAAPGYGSGVQGHVPGYGTAPPAPPAVAAPSTPPPGLEKMMLQSFCREYDIPLSTAVQRLGRHRITAFGDMSFEELALENNRTPADIMRLIVSP